MKSGILVTLILAVCAITFITYATENYCLDKGIAVVLTLTVLIVAFVAIGVMSIKEGE